MKPKILVVDDNKNNCDSLVAILKLKGYEAFEVYDGYQAIEAVKSQPFDIVLMDVIMTGLSGIETADLLRNIQAKIIVIIVTAVTDNAILEDQLKKDNLKVVQKPIDIDKLLNIIEEITGPADFSGV